MSRFTLWIVAGFMIGAATVHGALLMSWPWLFVIVGLAGVLIIALLLALDVIAQDLHDHDDEDWQ